MRKTADRIRHAISFEVIGLAIITPLGALAFDKPMSDVGVVAVVGATIATLWNYGYNLIFDITLNRITGTTLKSVPARLLHATLFEAGILALLLPFIAWYLQIGLWQAFVMDLSFAVFYLVYAFVFNWAYDRIFPLPEWKETGQSVP
ncbi:putative membrane protein [Primorskyibacter sedentarius]|uniref:Putative membrane protein n=1 Tax=Primorskyibacter sedentarius TaxID=745311 RepID=A0A4R3JLK9_9RHOB|nr:PACE efflux transporter [Primorskyibacter sedentarius]TCS67237.1 putative membrane protein [Primorskyibacter sedentarius]